MATKTRPGAARAAERDQEASGAPLVLAYAGCDTCRKALRFLAARGVTAQVRPIVDQPPTPDELRRWLPRSGLPPRKWLNTSGQSYRALGKDRVDAADDDTLLAWLAQDGKLVRRPVLVWRDRVLVGFQEAAYAALFGGAAG